MKRIVVFGENKYAELAYYYLTYDSPFEVEGFTVNEKYIRNNHMLGHRVVAFERVELEFSPREFNMFLPLSYQRVNRFREERYLEAKEKGYTIITYVSSKAVVWDDLVIGENCIVSENASLGPSVTIGDNVAIGPNVVVGHHSQVGDHCFISPGTVILGGARIGPYCLLGANSTIKEGVNIGAECIIGSGVYIAKSTKAKQVFINRSPDVLKKPSDELRGWFTWGTPSKTAK